MFNVDLSVFTVQQVQQMFRNQLPNNYYRAYFQTVIAISCKNCWVRFMWNISIRRFSRPEKKSKWTVIGGWSKYWTIFKILKNLFLPILSVPALSQLRPWDVTKMLTNLISYVKSGVGEVSVHELFPKKRFWTNFPLSLFCLCLLSSFHYWRVLLCCTVLLCSGGEQCIEKGLTVL